MNGSDKILLFLGSSTVTLWWAKVPQFFGGDFLASLRPGGARMAGKGSPPCPSSALPIWLPSPAAPREMTCGGEQRVKWVSQPEPLSSPLQEGEEAHRGFTPIPLALKADTGKRQGKEKTRKGQDKNVGKGGGGRVKAYEGQRRDKGQRQGWLTPVGFILSHVTSSWSWDHLTDNLWVGKSFSEAPTHWWSFKDNVHYQVDFIIYVLCWEEWVSFCKDDLSAKICFKCILLE